jgi:hypothetical protein
MHINFLQQEKVSALKDEGEENGANAKFQGRINPEDVDGLVSICEF